MLHYGDYFFGLVGTASFGQIDVIGKGIDEVCKMEGVMKTLSSSDQRAIIAISKAAAARLHHVSAQDFEGARYSLYREDEAGLMWREVQWVYSERQDMDTHDHSIAS